MMIHIVNPLGAALAHYSVELQSVLNAADVRSEITSQTEPGVSGHSRLHWVMAHFASVRRAASKCSDADFVVSTWPVLGYFDLALNRLVGRNRTWIIIHDPSPLVRSVGHGRFGRLVLRRSKLAQIICHSPKAVQTIADQGLKGACTLLPHPIAGGFRSGTKPTRTKRILVIGQYKADRDLGLIRYVGNHFHDEADLRIAGRGWPNLEYWDVEDRFLSEQEFCDEIASASLVLIPYRRFFQSGVAVRCVEMGIPFVGPKGSSLDQLVGSDSVMVQDIDDKDAWVDAIQKVFTMGHAEIAPLMDRYLNSCCSRWSEWLRLEEAKERLTIQDGRTLIDSR
jgi:hypothetical protein